MKFKTFLTMILVGLLFTLASCGAQKKGSGCEMNRGMSGYN